MPSQHFSARTQIIPHSDQKKDNQYFMVPSGFKVKENKLIIPKFMEGIEYRDESAIPAHIKQVVVTRDVNRYYASIQYESEEELPKGTGIMGIDMGIAHFMTTSDG